MRKLPRRAQREIVKRAKSAAFSLRPKHSEQCKKGEQEFANLLSYMNSLLKKHGDYPGLLADIGACEPNFKRREKILLKAFEIATERRDSNSLLSICHSLATAYADMGGSEKAIVWTNNLKKQLKKTPDPLYKEFLEDLKMLLKRRNVKLEVKSDNVLSIKKSKKLGRSRV